MKHDLSDQLKKEIERRGALFAVLLDPDSNTPESFVEAGVMAAENGADFFLIGGSFMGNPNFAPMIAELREKTKLPQVLFPGGASHVMPGPEAILFTSLVSGRNPNYLIDEQVRGAVMVRAYGLEPMPTAYLLIESGKTTAVEYISNTKPIPADKPKLSAVHCMAAEMMGMQWVYLEAGSGAKNPVPVEHIGGVKISCDLPIIVGGGIVTPEAAEVRVKAGASVIVTGNLWEKEKDPAKIAEFAKAIHYKEK